MLADSANFESKGVGFLSNRDNSDVKQLKWEVSRTVDKRKSFRTKFTKSAKAKNFKMKAKTTTKPQKKNKQKPKNKNRKKFQK
jgi:hypothetical protein